MDVLDLMIFGGLTLACVGLGFLHSWPLGLTAFGAALFVLGVVGAGRR